MHKKKEYLFLKRLKAIRTTSMKSEQYMVFCRTDQFHMCQDRTIRTLRFRSFTLGTIGSQTPVTGFHNALLRAHVLKLEGQLITRKKLNVGTENSRIDFTNTTCLVLIVSITKIAVFNKQRSVKTKPQWFSRCKTRECHRIVNASLSTARLLVRKFNNTLRKVLLFQVQLICLFLCSI